MRRLTSKGLSQRSLKQRLFSPLCFDRRSVIRCALWTEELPLVRLGDRWRDAEQRVIEDRKLEVILATLRTARAERRRRWCPPTSGLSRLLARSSSSRVNTGPVPRGVRR